MAERRNRERKRKRGREKKSIRMPVARSLRSYHGRGFDDLLTTAPDKQKANELRGPVSESVCCGDK